ncbi:MAG: fimbria/pilus periplasmic chaperone [Plesiomonas sp.]|uniref:fimbria/pilus periplasmic chaperone n=1 Tax=Plesiomonas sp. TaxID=2486279 RepID=UPI003F367522
MTPRGVDYLYMGVALIIILTAPTTNATISVDRTRVIFNGKDSTMGMTLQNNNEKQPYLAQSWIEDEKGNKSTDRIIVLPPLQRIEAKSKSQIKFQALPGLSLLPQDRESVFYLNVREIPPKTKKENVLQIALQTKIKLFYRPASLVVSRNDKPWQHEIVLKQEEVGAKVINPTPYYITLTDARSDKRLAVNNVFKTVMISPFSEHPIGHLLLNGTPTLSYINDHGGEVELTFSCEKQTCQVQDKK